MIKKISFLILSVAILVTGMIAFSKLGYWDRSVRIFSYSSNARFAERNGSGPEGREEFGEGDRFHEGEERSGFGRGNRNVPDSIIQKLEPPHKEQMGTGSFKRGLKYGESHGRGEFQGGNKVNLRNVLWFLAVFASFTVAAFYTDKGIKLIRKRNPGSLLL
jgi:hypothetical protein